MPESSSRHRKPPDTIADRCLTIFLQRKLRGQKVERLYTRRLKELGKPIANKFRAWASNEEVLIALENATPVIPEDWDDRAVDICWPLLAIAEMAGGHWPETARAALGEICGTGPMRMMMRRFFCFEPFIQSSPNQENSDFNYQSSPGANRSRRRALGEEMGERCRQWKNKRAGK